MRALPPSAFLAFAFAIGCSGASSAGDSPSAAGDPSGESPAADAGPVPVFGGNVADGSTAPATASDLSATIRDFRVYDPSNQTTNPDFENVPATDANGNPNPGYLGPWDDRGVVATTLGGDGKPTYAHAGAKTLTTHGEAAFNQWYRSVPGTNIEVTFPIHLTANADGSFSYDSAVTGVPLSASDPTRMFFPIDDGSPFATPFGNQGSAHNYSFTVEIHTVFTYRGGEFFRFRGDDDVFVFIDGKLAVDLGGIHGPEVAEVTIDTLGLQRQKTYALDFFFAERHRVGSNVLFSTTLDLRPAPR